MILNVKAVKRLSGQLQLAASKSYSIRAFIIAACAGTSTIKNISHCDDALVAIRTARALGASISRKAKQWHVKARGIKKETRLFKVGESGTTLRFLLPLLSLYTKRARVVGAGTLRGRPCSLLCQTLRAQGMDIRGEGLKEAVPIVYKGGCLRGGRISIDGSVSSQFISALLIALPSVKESSRLYISGQKIVSQDYTLMTMQILARAGVVIKKLSQREFFIRGNQQFKGLKNFCIPSDYGLAAFWMAACALVPSDVVLQGILDDELAQSDRHILAFMRRMGVRFRKTQSAIYMRGPFDLKGGSFSLKDCPDLLPIMSILALFAKSPTKLFDIHHARLKESDRIGDLSKELLKIGACLKQRPDSLTIYPQASYKKGQRLDAHHDHRLAMSFAILGLRLGCRVDGIESSQKSYPDFVCDMKALAHYTESC